MHIRHPYLCKSSHMLQNVRYVEIGLIRPTMVVYVGGRTTQNGKNISYGNMETIFVLSEAKAVNSLIQFFSEFHKQYFILEFLHAGWLHRIYRISCSLTLFENRETILGQPKMPCQHFHCLFWTYWIIHFNMNYPFWNLARIYRSFLFWRLRSHMEITIY